ncbi:L-histidine N(alpha)-methyltransferase [Shewanella sp. 0m-8]
MIKQFIDDVNNGLSQSQKQLPSKYFYDKKGDELFVKIMSLKEYYLTRSEMEIFSEQVHSIIAALKLEQSSYFELIELGAGDGTKTRKLLQALSDEGYQYDYMPIDISKNALDKLEHSLAKELPNVCVKQQHGDYFSILESLRNSHHPKVLLFLGSNLGNMPDNTATEFIYNLGKSLCDGDKLLIGLDMVKSADIVLPAYNDQQGVTRDFNLNLLQRINTELDADFNLELFDHSPEYTEQEGIAKSYLKSLCDQSVSIKATGKVYQFSTGEKIHTEISRKYSDAIFDRILSPTDFVITSKFTDSQQYFADYILTRVCTKPNK